MAESRYPEHRYPEHERRRRMLHLIHEWTISQPEAEPILRYHEFIELVGVAPADPEDYSPDEVYRQAADHINRFMRLVDEGYINGRYASEFYGGPPFTISWIKGLSERGMQVIEELSDPQAELLARLDSIADAIRTLNDEDAPPEQKRVAETAVNELKHFVRGLPSGATVELASRLFG